MPTVSGVALQRVSLANFRETVALLITTMASIYTGLAAIIAFGVVYNSARISLSERARELASLRVLGFTRGEVLRILLLELALLTLSRSRPDGSWATASPGSCKTNLAGELMRVRLVVEHSTYVARQRDRDPGGDRLRAGRARAHQSAGPRRRPQDARLSHAGKLDETDRRCIAGRGAIAAGLTWFAWPRPVAVDLATVAKGPMEVTVDDEGKTRVRHVYTVSAPIAGKVLRISHPLGEQGLRFMSATR